MELERVKLERAVVTAALAIALAATAVGCAVGSDDPDEDGSQDDTTSAGNGGSGPGTSVAATTGAGASGPATAGATSGAATTGATSGASTSAGSGGASASSPCANQTVPGGGTGFVDVQEMFGYINQTRQTYTSHTPLDGYPWVGVNSTMTWDVTMAWDDQLAAQAESKAQAVAQGAQPDGGSYGYSNAFGAPGEVMWLSGLDSAVYQVIALSDGQLQGPPSNPSAPYKWHHVQNGQYRQAIAYQTGTAPFNHKKKIGIGQADGGSDKCWWVLLFAE